MSAALPGIIFIAAILGIGWLRGRRLARDRDGHAVLAEHWAATADRRGAERDHAVWELGQCQRRLAETIAERDKAVLLLLQHAARLERETGAAVAVLMARVAQLTAQLSEHLAAIDEDTIAVELRELLEQEATP